MPRPAPPLFEELFCAKTPLRDTYPELTDGEPLKRLSSLNVFIGVNNSGKSRLLRGLFASQQDRFLPFIAKEHNALISEVRAKIHELKSQYGAPTDRNFNTTLDQLQDIGVVRQAADILQPFINAVSVLSNCQSTTRQPPNPQNATEYQKYAEQLKPQLERLRSACPAMDSLARWYIPALRGLRHPSDGRDLFRARAKKDHFAATELGHVAPERNQGILLSSNIRHEIFAGLDLYVFIHDYLLGSFEQREKIRQFEEFLGVEFFDGQRVTLIPRVNDDVVHVKIGNEAEQPIYNLGDGIQQIIILTFPIFLLADKPLLLFIEEPELFLHPGLQRKLIRALIDTPGIARQTFVATHSNHFLDITLEESRISVFRFRKYPLPSNQQEVTPAFSIQPLSNKDFPFLRELGVTNSSVMLANCTIWVEGITDRLYFQKYLELYWAHTNQSYVEGIHFAFVEYGGACITHWSFLENEPHPIDAERLCGELFLIVDCDKGKDVRHAKLQEKLGDRFRRLGCREVENLLSPTVIKRVVASYEGVDDINLAKNFEQNDYRDDYLGTFIEDSVLPDNLKSKRQRNAQAIGNKGAYAAESGTLKDKLGFASKAIAAMNSVDDLSMDARKLCEEVTSFIQNHNPELRTINR